MHYLSDLLNGYDFQLIIEEGKGFLLEFQPGLQNNLTKSIVEQNTFKSDINLYFADLGKIQSNKISPFHIPDIFQGISKGLVLSSFNIFNSLHLQLFLDLKLCNPGFRVFMCLNENTDSEAFIYIALKLGFDGIVLQEENRSRVYPVESQYLSLIDNNVNALDKDKTKIEKLRNSIDEADSEILNLLSRRIDLVNELADLKFKNKMSILQISRWNNILNNVSASADTEEKCIELKYILNAIHISAIKAHFKSFGFKP